MREGERRLAAIMFTDIVDYTAMSQRDEKAALKMLQWHNDLLRPIFAKHHGQEIKTIGDSFLVEFGSALEATDCAVEIQRFLHDNNVSSKAEWRVQLRIGIHLGDVVHVPGDVLGDAVNIASRIEPLAEAGGVCVSTQVFDQVRNKVSQPIVRVTARELKNVQFPIDVYKIVMPWDETVASVPSPGEAKTPRIAVLPFANMSPDPGNEYIADGMTEELIDGLSRVRGLRVIARTSVMSYKKKDMKASEIARELGVGTLVEGSVRIAGKRIRVTVQLIDAGTEEHLWSYRYDRELDDVFAIQSGISEKVSEELRIQLAESEKHLLERKPTENTEAYMLYLKGRYYWNERTQPSLEKGIRYLKKAIELDPNFALAYSDLASAYEVMGDYGIMPPQDSYYRVQEFAVKALRIDPTLSQPHAALAAIHRRNFQSAAAEKEFKLAIELNPNNATAHQWNALDMLFRGREAESVQEYRKAKELDPLSPIIGAGLGYALVRSGRKEEGLNMLKMVTEMDESFEAGHMLFAFACILVGMKAEAVQEAKKITGLGTGGTASAASVYASAGLREEATLMLDRLLNDRGTKFTDPFDIAMIYSALGDENNALEWLDKAVNEKSARVARVKAWPFFDSLSSNPRFKDVVGRAGLQ